MNDTLALSGVIDHTSVLALIKDGAGYLSSVNSSSFVVDWAQVTYANSAALAMLLQWTRQVEGAGKTLVSQNAPEFLVQLARLSQLEFLFS
ncbi:MAG TPA: STAS domain-containing protein [Cellvibrionaceae bacterium]